MKIWLLIFTLSFAQQFANAASASIEEKPDSHTYTVKDYHKEFEEERKEAEAKGFARGLAKGEAKGQARGEAKGREEALLEVLTNLKAAGKTPEYAATATKLPIEQVRSFYAEAR